MGRDETESGIALPRFPLIQLTKELLPVHKGLQSPDYTPKKCFAKIWLHFGWLYCGSGVMDLMVVTARWYVPAKQFSGDPHNKSSGRAARS